MMFPVEFMAELGRDQRQHYATDAPRAAGRGLQTLPRPPSPGADVRRNPVFATGAASSTASGCHPAESAAMPATTTSMRQRHTTVVSRVMLLAVT